MMRRQLALLLGVLSGFSSSQEGSAFAQSAEAASTPPVRSTRALSRRAARSDVAAPVRLLVLEAVPEFSARVRGQVSDLGLALAVEAATPVSTRPEVEALMAARAAEQPVDVVAWLGELPGASPTHAHGMTVCVWIVGHERVHARQIGPRAIDARPDEERSATLEAAALVVRSAVRAVSFEREGREHAAASPEAPAAPALSLLAALPAAAPEVDRGLADDGEGEGNRQGMGWSPHAGIEWSHAGLNPNGFWSANAGLDLQWGSLSAGVGGGWGFVEPVAYRGVTFEIERRSLVAEVGWAVLHRPTFVLRPKLAAGAAWLTRTTRGLTGSVDAEPPSTSLSAIASGELVAEYRLAGPFTLGLHGGLRWFAHTTRYVVETPSGDVALAAGWRVQPNAGIALGAQF
jgi:hypothetical protein